MGGASDDKQATSLPVSAPAMFVCVRVRVCVCVCLSAAALAARICLYLSCHPTTPASLKNELQGGPQKVTPVWHLSFISLLKCIILYLHFLCVHVSFSLNDVVCRRKLVPFLCD